VLLACTVFAVLGCGPTSPIVGTWDDIYAVNDNPKEHMARYVFNANGTFVETTVNTLGSSQVLSGESSGHYALGKDELVLNIEEDSASVAMPDGTPHSDSGASNKKKTYKFKWVSPDRFSITAFDSTYAREYVRKK
jgi:hypothetical protein